ncbi:MAG: desulfoferrodoxin [Deltaproteobacteria bacterium]|nr:desulfoferrodoxin [Deltaproteobacteria bacterium]MBW2072336.1 desulfoferrodoxin [Deltaproteobacteria bacterium]
MQRRRDFIKTSLVMAGGMVLSSTAKVGASGSEFPKGVIYTKDNPGQWSKKAATHAPQVKVEGKKVTISTPHPMSEKHYIVRHTLVTDDGKVLGAKTFYPVDQPVSTYEVNVDKGSRLYATSFCNLHDFWISVVIV